ncbi:unnamed protein product, partial [marine sediment metagenome]
VTMTMAEIGILLEWPPVTVTYQVALVGSPVARVDPPVSVEIPFEPRFIRRAKDESAH